MSARIPRLEQSEMPPDLAARLEPRVKRLGYLGEFFKVAANQPRVLSTFMQLTDDLKEALPDRLTEVVALTVSTATNNAYERHQHERLSEKLGYGREWILEVMSLGENAGKLMSSTEQSAQKFTLAALRTHGRNCREELESLVTETGPEQAVAIILLVGRYLTHSIFVNALGLKPPVPSIFPGGTEGTR